MSVTKPRPDALIATVVLLTGWVVSVGIRSWQGVEVNIGAEMGAAALAVGVVYRQVSRRRNDEDGEG